MKPSEIAKITRRYSAATLTRHAVVAIGVLALLAGCRANPDEPTTEQPSRVLGEITTAPAEGPCPASRCITFVVDGDDLLGGSEKVRLSPGHHDPLHHKWLGEVLDVRGIGGLDVR